MFYSNALKNKLYIYIYIYIYICMYSIISGDPPFTISHAPILNSPIFYCRHNNI